MFSEIYYKEKKYIARNLDGDDKQIIFNEEFERENFIVKTKPSFNIKHSNP